MAALIQNLLHLLTLPFHLLFSALGSKNFFSFITLKELFLHLFFLFHDLRPTTISLTNPSATVHLWLPSPRQNRKQKPPLLLLHGYGAATKWQWENQLRPLSQSFDLYIPDLVFFGDSSSATEERSVEFQARCMAAAMRELGVAKYAVAGISYGGFVAFRMAADVAKEEVERVVIMSAGVCASEEELRWLAEREGRDVSEILLPRRPEDLMLLLRRSMYRPPTWIPAFVLEDYIQATYKNQRKERVELLKDLIQNGINMEPLPILNQETLLIWGENDNFFPLLMAHQLHRYLGKKSSLELIKEAGHALPLEKPKDVNQLIKKFLINPSYIK